MAQDELPTEDQDDSAEPEENSEQVSYIAGEAVSDWTAVKEMSNFASLSPMEANASCAWAAGMWALQSAF